MSGVNVTRAQGPLRRVVLIGSECTGKTTLARQLAARYETVWSAEFVRQYLDAKGGELGVADVDAIARGQIALEDQAARDARGGLLVCDTCLLSTLIYSRHYYDYSPPWLEAEVLARRADLYLLTWIDVPWQADGQRDRPHAREQMHRLFENELRARSLPYQLMRGDEQTRLAQATAAIASLLAGQPVCCD